MAEPASAVLALSLIQKSPLEQQNAEEQGSDEAENTPTWDLIDDIDMGVPLPPNRNVFSCGRVVGISGLRPTSSGPAESNDGENDLQTWVCEVCDIRLVILIFPKNQVMAC